MQNPDHYTPWVDKFMLQAVKPVSPTRSIPEQLLQRGIDPNQVDSVIFR
jgi:hypothetical protein